MYSMYQALFSVAYVFFFNLYNTSEGGVPQFHIRKYKCKIFMVAHLCTGEVEAGGLL